MTTRFTIAIILLTTVLCNAQRIDRKNAYRIEGENIVLYMDDSWPRDVQEDLLGRSGMRGLSLDTLWRFGSVGQMAKDGWKVLPTGPRRYKIYKAVSDLSGNLKWNQEVVLFSNLWEKMVKQTSAVFGFNLFSDRQTVSTTKDDAAQFFLPGRTNANNVFLSGTFNNWSTGKTPMTKTDSGWVVTVPLKPGKHCYKFIVDGRWINDQYNKHKEDDYVGGQNSVYFKSNYEFKLEGFTSALSVVVAGTFNDWNDSELKMKRTATGWRIPIYLKEGTYAYRLIVDKKWITDPGNPESRSDGNGNRNSYLRLGEPATFQLKGHADAHQVIVAGEFNNWNEKELAMRKTADGWALDYVLGSGNYAYKYIVDGEWMIDPLNPYTTTQHGHQNSLKAIKPNHTFVLKGFAKANNVQVAGNFNDWTGYTMKQTADGWTIDVFLPAGKCLYKFVVDGAWMIDKGNDLWEQNQYGTGNSVLWIAPL